MLLLEGGIGGRQTVELPPSMINTTDMPKLIDSILTASRSTFFAFICGAWAVNEPTPDCDLCDGQGMKRNPDGRMVTCPKCGGRGGEPDDYSKHPDREEVVFVYVGDGDRVLMWDARVFRPRRQRPTLGPWREHGEMQGRIANALRRPKGDRDGHHASADG